MTWEAATPYHVTDTGSSYFKNQDGCRRVVGRPRPGLEEGLMADPGLSPTGLFHPLKAQLMLPQL